jgi:hypothetical protein
MNDQHDRNKVLELLEDNGQEQPEPYDNVHKLVGKKSLIVDNDGFVKEIGEGDWRKYDPQDDQ